LLLQFRKAQEIALAVKQSFETVVMCELYPKSQIDIFITVLQADGGISPPHSVALECS
jgi:exosome complex component RRP41